MLKNRVALLAAMLASAFLWLPRGARAQITDPIIPGVSVEIADVIRLPDTRGQGAEDSRSAANYARINFMRETPGDPSSWFVNDLRGQVYRVKPDTQEVALFLDVGAVFPDFIIGPGGLSTGLITVALHPEFQTNGKFYTIHEESAAGNPATPDFQATGNPGNIANGQHGVLTEWTANNPSASTFTGTHREVLRIAQPSGNLHNLGDIGFNPLASPEDPDYGLMYVAGGDGGYDAYGKGSKQARVDASIFGKLLRIDPDGSDSANGQYGIAGDNAFAADGDPGSLGEIFAEGFRNLHRISWDLETGLLLGTDIGQGAVEEVNLLRNGEDYGWDDTEGTFTRGGGTLASQPTGVTLPVAQYDHGDGLAIAGGFVYRGTSIPELVGKFVYGDIVNGRLFYSDLDDMIAAETDGDFTKTAPVYELFLSRDGESVTLEELILERLGLGSLPRNRHDLRLGQTSDGEVYLMTKQDGMIRALVGQSPMPGDFNNDGVVDAADYAVWRNGLGTTYDQDDYLEWRSHYGATSSPAASAPTPEPSSIPLVALASIRLVLRRNR